MTEHSFNSPQDRYTDARLVRELSQGTFEYRLEKELDGSNRAIVDRGTYSGERPNANTSLFLCRKTHRGNWIAKVWPKDKNPWITRNLPMVGQVLEGRVQSIVNEDIAILTCEWQGFELEAALFSDNLPETFVGSNLLKILTVGDRIRGVLTPHDFSNIQLRMNVNTWRKTLERYWTTKEKPNTELEIPRVLPRTEVKSRPLEGKRCLLIDDDQLLCEAVSSRLSSSGANTCVVHSGMPLSIRQQLAESSFDRLDAIVADFHFDAEQHDAQHIFREIQRLASETGAQVLVWSGNLQSASEFANEQNYHFLPKPANLSVIENWISSGSLEKQAKANPKRTALFSVDSKTENIISRATTTLDSLVRRYSLSLAFWLIVHDENLVEVRAATKQVDPSERVGIETEFRNSFVSRAIRTKRAESGKIPRNDPIRKLLLPTASNYFVLPLDVDGHSPRYIFFLSDRIVSPEVMEGLKHREDHFLLLIDAITQAEAIDEISSSAQLGRIALSTLHELRSEIAKLEAVSTAEIAPEQKLEYLRHALPKISDLSRDELRRFRPGNNEAVRLDVLVASVVERMTWYIDDERPSARVSFAFDVDDVKGIALSLNAFAIERALINLMDNAAVFASESPIRMVWVEVSKVKNDELHSYRLRVTDTGYGISKKQAAGIFQARRSGRSLHGTGLGLYISGQLIEALGGRLEVVMQPLWGGACFDILLPAEMG